jgi:dipeptidyl aminopeptidase/acylaminoacyl peptidase
MVAFACGTAVCLADLTAGVGTAAQVVVLEADTHHAAEISWAPDGAALAVVDRDPNGITPVRLLTFSRAGDVLLDVAIAPGDAVDPPQWTPDGLAILVQTYPQDGRRIIAVHTATGQVLDLSQEHWDAYFALSPDGSQLLLNNGRGDFWLAPITLRQNR